MRDLGLWRKVDSGFREGDVDGTIHHLEEALSAENVDRFKKLIGSRFTNPPSDILSSVNDFANSCGRSFDVQAVYLEMNGFDINYDRWYFDFFAYSHYSEDPDDLDWLSDWQSDERPDITLTGLEHVQRDFEWYHENEIYKEESHRRAYDISLLLVMTNFVSLVGRALAAGPLAKDVPVLATAHGFDVIGRFHPGKDGSTE